MKLKKTLFCFPYSGASASFYLRWGSKFRQEIKIQPVEYPGRGTRFGEKFSDSMDELVESIMPVIENNFSEHMIFFGHSLGGLVAYEATLKLRSAGYTLPSHLFLSGITPPHLKYGEQLLHRLPDTIFLKEVGKFGGMSKEILDNQEILNMYLPVIRADYRIYELYQSHESDPLSIDISIFSGREDELASGKDMLEWQQYTNRKFNVRHLDGDHFFVHKQLDCIIAEIEERYKMMM